MCWDEDRDLYLRLNKALVSMDPVTEQHDIARAPDLMLSRACGGHRLPQGPGDPGPLGGVSAACFKKILPRDYDRMLRTIAQFEDQGMSHEQAEVEAFYANTKE